MQLSELPPTRTLATKRHRSALGTTLMGGGAFALLAGALIDFAGGTLANLGSTGLTVMSWQSLLYYSGAIALVIGAQVRRRSIRLGDSRSRADGEL